MGRGQLAVAGGQALRELVEVELVEVDGSEALAHCGKR
jgi:hypothetical protein